MKVMMACEAATFWYSRRQRNDTEHSAHSPTATITACMNYVVAKVMKRRQRRSTNAL